MEDSHVKNKRIAKNTLFLYGRMLFSLVVSLYTSRVVLEVLGVSNYGVYNVVGGVVGMFLFLNGSMAGATSRFITYELGKGSPERLKTVFNNAMAVHVAIAGIIVLICETFGLWFLEHKLVIPSESKYAAQWIFQISVLTAVLGMTQVPYSAILIAHERMNVFAYFDILGTILRLAIVYLLMVLPGDSLIWYAIMLAAVSIGMLIIYRVYCIRHFAYARLSVKILDFREIKPMLLFSGWDLYGNMSVMARTQGINMLVNMFFGTVANAAVGIANSIQAAVNGFASNVTAALKPQIIKSYASGDYTYMSQLLFRGAKFSFLIILLIGLPILLETHFILSVWLVKVPEYSVWIARFTLAFIFFSNVSVVLVSGVHATGDIRGPSLINGSMYLLVVPITYIVYKEGGTIYIPFILNALFVFFGAMLNFIYTRNKVRILSFRKFLAEVVFRCLTVAILAAIIPLSIQYLLPEGWMRLIAVTITSLLATGVLSYWLAFNCSERRFVLGIIKKILHIKTSANS